jgi:Spy/CpxP family protein refolding chaperone
MKLIPLLLAAGLALSGTAPWAQDATPAPGQDPLAEQVFPPELVMRHQKTIRLSDAQKTALIAEVKQAQGRLLELQWELQRAMEPLVDQLSPVKVDERQALAELDKVLAAEREVKRVHLMLAARLKNILTPEQQRALRELRGQAVRGAEPARPGATR